MNKKSAINEFRVIFTGGGSGGHTMPALSMIDSLKNECKKKKINPEILYIGSKNGIEKTLTDRSNIRYSAIKTGKLRRYVSLKNFTDIFKIIIGLFQSMGIIKKFKPAIVVSTGGFVSVPPVIAAKSLKIPVIIHEQTIDAGLANKIAGKFADKIALTFNESSKYFPSSKTIVTGLPLRKEIFSGTKKSAKKRFKFDFKLPVVYFTGGGQGCHILNLTALKILPCLLDKCNVIFQTGKNENNNDYPEFKKFYSSLNPKRKRRIYIFDFIHEELGDVLAITNLAVSRSGAGSVNEFLALKIPAIFIPLEIATNNEQLKNAKIPEKRGGAVIIEEKNLTGEILLKHIENILFTKKLKCMSDNLKKFDFKDGSKNMLDLIFEYMKLQ